MKQRKALVTGASHGIGKAIATRFAAEGCDLILNCKTDHELLRATAHDLSATYGIRTQVISCDVGDHAAVCDMFEQIRAFFDGDGIDILVNNAGISQIGLLTDLSIDDWNRVIATNLTSVFSCCHEALPHMVHQKSGCIINIS